MAYLGYPRMVNSSALSEVPPNRCASRAACAEVAGRAVPFGLPRCMDGEPCRLPACDTQARYLEARARVEAEVASRAQSDKRIRALVAAVAGDAVPATSILGPVATISQVSYPARHGYAEHARLWCSKPRAWRHGSHGIATPLTILLLAASARFDALGGRRVCARSGAGQFAGRSLRAPCDVTPGGK